ncbi:hypothetical protein SAMN05216353_13931 [Halobacillus alkaliphilus]|uniref:Uncharacterized protein n=1 Tax=Halobacillus alkaliphilus TaxID=396056 RepID=A0A1I2REM5_9BACI|nr:hypothetical protein [Halobacillus alkaliphilus]SFG39008.1 hypothetical protein SAMN05216353_13931 [Halobacillus alkaliphilus]
MGPIQTVWLDECRKLGIVKCRNSVFGNLYYPITIDPEQLEYGRIHQLWYTTYNGARQFFRLNTNNYHVSGRMRQESPDKIQMKPPVKNNPVRSL